MNGMNFEEWQALMRAQRNGGTSSEIHNHEAVISNKNPNSESGNAAADELRAKQRYHNEQSKGMATDRKEEVAPSRDGVMFANILTTDYMAAEYKGKLIVRSYDSNPMSVAPVQGKIDAAIEQGATWEFFLGDSGPLLSNLRHEDEQPVLISECIPIESVPTDADIFISAGEGYYIQN